jgi:hypothetical protein
MLLDANIKDIQTYLQNLEVDKNLSNKRQKNVTS